jgi:hypothetical protein
MLKIAMNLIYSYKNHKKPEFSIDANRPMDYI